MIGSALTGVQQELGELKTIKGTVTRLSDQFTETWKNDVDGKLQVLELCDSDKDFQIKLLTNTVVRQQEQIDMLKTKVEAIQNREV